MLKTLANILVGLVAVGSIGFAAYTYLEGRPCVNPIGYHLGSFDKRFGVSDEYFMQETAKAAALWNGALGKELFKPDAQGKLSINLVYDDRQKNT